MRLAKHLAHAGVASRRAAEAMIAEGRVAVDGETVTDPARAVTGAEAIAVDGTKVQANASRNENLDYEQLAREILEEAKATDAAEDELYGEARGDELPEQLRTVEGRRA